MRESSRRLATWLALALVGSLVSVCTDSTVSTPNRTKSAGVAVAPMFSSSATTALQALRDASIDIDRVHVTIVRLPSETLAEQTAFLAGRGQQFVLEFTVPADVGETLMARVEFLVGTTTLFAGSGPVVARAASDQSSAPDQVTVLPVGPGANATRVTVTPASGTFPTTAPVTFTGHAFDQSGNEITGALFTWSVDNAAVGSVSATGVVQPTTTGGPLHVRAATLNGVTGEAAVTFAAAGTPVQLAIATQPGGAVSGLNLATQPVVQIRDANNTLVSTSSLAVTAAIASGTGTLVGTRTVNAVSGVASFTNLRIDGTGPHTLTFTATGLTAATSSSFTVTQTVVALVVQTPPGGATSGRAFTIQPVVRIADNAGLTVAGSTLPVTARITSGSGTLVGTTTVNAANGVATFTDLRIDGSGAYTLTFSTATPALQVVSPSFTVGAPAASQLAIAQQPGGAVSGLALTTQPIIEVRDASNALVTSSNASITALIATGSGTLAGTSTVTAVNGVATFTDLRINGSGAHTLVFSASGLTSATSAAFTVAQTAASLSIQTQPGGATSGAPMLAQPVIRILDNAGVLVTSATQTVTAVISSGNGRVVSGGSVNAVGGVATFTALRVDGTGPQMLTFSTATPSLQVTSTGFAVNAAGPTHIVIMTQPNGAVSGLSLTTQPVVAILDANNAIVTGSTGSILAEIASGTGRLIGNTSASAVNGVATFTNLRIDGVGTHTIKFTAIGLPVVTSLSFTVTQTPASLSIQTQPAGSISGSPLMIQPVIRVLDNAGLVVVDYTLSVTAIIGSGQGTVAAGGSVNASNGIATFTSLRIDGTGPVTLIFTTTTPALHSVPSQGFAVNSPGAPPPGASGSGPPR